MIILDTNVISELVKPQPNEDVVKWVGSLNEVVGTTAVNAAELRAGLRLMPMGRRRAQLERLIFGHLESFDQTGSILAFDQLAATDYAEVIFARMTAGYPISAQDAMIAAICRARGCTLATRNVKNFEGTGVIVVNPWVA
ncbi:type II toxin-antitoxin system VapC family toxin [Corynebacterium bouchesdurhonense]|uniref:type II toxin-antitoxin system VapC family toxin n=1 Tax=Corynebacterium bouchesdurhonense TaxID=1720192 RepID=UPI000835A6DC|nr:type II toxin-antitoxin system VapC family toxin [Corynebacterium bouchesdurhonense]